MTDFDPVELSQLVRRVEAQERRLDTQGRDSEMHAKTISELVINLTAAKTAISALELDKAVQVEKDKSRDEKINGIWGLGRYVLFAVCGLAIALVFGFFAKGGFNLG